MLFKKINFLTNILQFQANATHWIHNDPRSFHVAAPSVPDNPHFGYVVERLWTTLFNCTKRDLPDRCARNECACFD